VVNIVFDVAFKFAITGLFEKSEVDNDDIDNNVDVKNDLNHYLLHIVLNPVYLLIK
jgi:hypothetical protein